MRSVTSSHFTAEKTETRRPWLPQGPRAEAETGARLCSPIPWPRRHRPPGRPGPGRRGLVSPWSLTSVEAAARRPRTVLCSDPCPHILLVCPIDLLSFSPPLAPRWAPGFSFIQVAPESKASSQGRCPCPAQSLSLSLCSSSVSHCALGLWHLLISGSPLSSLGCLFFPILGQEVAWRPSGPTRRESSRGATSFSSSGDFTGLGDSRGHCGTCPP